VFARWRHQLPVYSPLPGTALASALAAAIRDGPAEMNAARSLIAQEFAADDVLLTDSGRAALQLAIELATARRGHRRRVCLPAFQCYEVATAAVGADCEILLYDVDPATLRPDMESLERALSAGPSAVVVAPLYGLPADWEAVDRLAGTFGALVIEDAAQASGASWKGRPLGSLGTMSVVSFGRGKGWTGGGGGALLMRGAGLTDMRAARLPATRLAGTVRTGMVSLLQVVFGRPSLYGVPAAIPALGLGETRYHEPRVLATQAPFSAALLRRTLAAAHRESEVRRLHADRWRHMLGGSSRTIPEVLPGGTAGYLRFPLRLSPAAARHAARGDARRVGVARSYPLPLSELAAVQPRLATPLADAPGARALARELVTLPTHSRLTERDWSTIESLLKEWERA
jgi:perosamine synthetase